MKEFNYAPPQSAAETDPNAALQAQLDQATAKIAELKAEMEKFEKELFHTTQSVLSAINQQQGTLSHDPKCSECDKPATAKSLAASCCGLCPGKAEHA